MEKCINLCGIASNTELKSEDGHYYRGNRFNCNVKEDCLVIELSDIGIDFLTLLHWKYSHGLDNPLVIYVIKEILALS